MLSACVRVHVICCNTGCYFILYLQLPLCCVYGLQKLEGHLQQCFAKMTGDKRLGRFPLYLCVPRFILKDIKIDLIVM